MQINNWTFEARIPLFIDDRQFGYQLLVTSDVHYVRFQKPSVAATVWSIGCRHGRPRLSPRRSSLSPSPTTAPHWTSLHCSYSTIPPAIKVVCSAVSEGCSMFIVLCCIRRVRNFIELLLWLVTLVFRLCFIIEKLENEVEGVTNQSVSFCLHC